MKIKFIIVILVTCIIIAIVTQACLSSKEPVPERNFNAADLLIDQSQLTSDWISTSRSEERSCDSYGYFNCTELSEITFTDLLANIKHSVGRFESERFATRNYNEHNFTRNSNGQLPFSWAPLIGFTYKSPVADQYRVVCDTKWDGFFCIIEAQYEEYVSLLFFHGSMVQSLAIYDLELLAKAIDFKMANYLDK